MTEMRGRLGVRIRLRLLDHSIIDTVGSGVQVPTRLPSLQELDLLSGARPQYGRGLRCWLLDDCPLSECLCLDRAAVSKTSKGSKRRSPGNPSRRLWSMLDTLIFSRWALS